MSLPEFQGSADQQALAAEVYRLMATQAAMFADDAPITQTLANLAEFLAAQRGSDQQEVAAAIDSALALNEDVFHREERNGEVYFVTTRYGRYVPRQEDASHMFKNRLYEPDNPLPIDDISVVVSTSRPALTTVEPVFISDYWQIQAGLTPVVPVDEGEEGAEPPSDAAGAEEAVLAPEWSETAATAGVEQPVAEEADAEVPTEVSTVAETAATPVEAGVPAAAEAAVAEPVEAAAALMDLPDGTTIDLGRPVDALLAEYGKTLETQLLAQLEQDPLRRIVSFGRSCFPEASLVSLGKNDMRRIRDYILEMGEPLLDTAIIADLYYHSPRQSDYEAFRFSLNYRLSREKDFEFVGVEGARLWATKGLPAIGTKRIKAGEMAHLTSYLVEGYDDSLAERSAEEIEATSSFSHVLTFFEWQHGVLVLNAGLSALLPAPLLADQRSAVLRIDSPQHYTSYLVEVRYPTGNRGGWVQGLDEFFHEHVVPGAVLTMSRTEEPNVFQIAYTEAAGVSERLLSVDEKKNKFVFADIEYFNVVNDEWLPSQQKHGRLRNLKALPMSERRKADTVLAHVFETIGEQVGERDAPRYWSSLDDLLVAYNVLRPASRLYLEGLLADEGHYEPDEATPGAYYFTPEVTAEEEEEEAEAIISYDDDEE